MRRINWHLLQKKFPINTYIRNIFLSFALLSPGSITLIANPHKPVVVAGTAEFNNKHHKTLDIHTSDKTIINWNDFSIGKGEVTNFIQPSKSSAVLNRVTGGNLSSIYGSLQANGSVYLINPHGVLVADGAVINTGSFLASTLDVLDADFLAGQEMLFSGNSQASVINYGTIESNAGDVVLIGYKVDNQGSIKANEGAARLFAGSEMLLQINGEEKIVIHPKSVLQQKDEGVALNNNGTIDAVVAELKADGNPYLFGINHEGSINATGIVTQNGQVFLRADNGRTSVAGNIKASNYDNKGGDVTILGEQIGIWNTSVIDVSGDNGGGVVQIGGGYQGSNLDLPNASQVVVQKGANVNANANLNGDGGTIINWSDNSMHYYGTMSAKGGNLNGNGGFVETSGKKFLDYQGVADLTASNGEWGTLLLDPTNLFIQSPSSASPILHSPSPFYPGVPGTPANISPATIQTNLALGNVVIQTGDDGGAGAGDIIWLEPIANTSPNYADLTIQSANNIYISNSAGGSVGGYVNTSSSGDLNLFAQNNIYLTSGSILSDSFLFSVNGNINMTAINGDINIDGSIAPATFTSTKNINVTAENGSFLTTGSSRSSFNAVGYSSINGTFSINTGLDCIFTTGSAVSAGIFLTTNQLNMNIGGSGRFISKNNDGLLQIRGINGINASFAKDLVLEGGFGSNSQSAFTCNSGALDLTIGQDLYLTGGSGQNSFAAINFTSASATTPADILISVGRDLVMQGGSDFNDYTQIGSIGLTDFSDTSSNGFGIANITISKVGRNAILNSNGLISGSFAAIGHGNFSLYGQGNISGNIIFNGSPNTSLTLNVENSGSSSFSQIGHYKGNWSNSALVNISGNISLDNFGGDINLNLIGNNSAFSSTSIGHGSINANILPPSISGNVSLLNNTGNINLNPGTYGQIGHIGAVSLAGDVTVVTEGNINLITGGSSSSKSIIGHANFFTPPSTSLFSGKIVVSCDTLQLTSGGSDINGFPRNAVIGFEPPSFLAESTIIPNIDPTSEITVTALHDINLQGSISTTNQFPQGNAIIGFSPNAGLPNPTIPTINQISVTSTLGNITLNSGTNQLPIVNTGGICLIGTDSLIDGVILQSNVSVAAPNGTITLYGAPPGDPLYQGSGSYISTGKSLNNFDLNITAKNLRLFGTNGLQNSIGTALINSSRNINLNISGDLNLTANNGLAQISQGNGTLTASVDGSVSLIAGVQNDAQIGNNRLDLGANSIIFEKIGGDLLLQGNSVNSILEIPSARIGNGNRNTITTTIQGDINFVDIGGNINLIGGVGLSSSAVIGNGFYSQSENVQGDILFGNIGGNVNMIGGSGLKSFSRIGHGVSLAYNNISGKINFNTIGGNVLLQGGTGNTSIAMIGHGNNTTMRGPNLVIGGDILFDRIGGNLTLNGGSGVSAPAIIGNGLSTQVVSNLSGDVTINSIIGNVNLNASKIGSSTNSFAQIGPVGSTDTQNVNSNVRLNNVNGSVNVIGGAFTGNSATIGLLNPQSSNTQTLTGDVIVHAKDVTLTGGSTLGTSATIGFPSNPNFAFVGPTINSSLVEVIAKGPVTLNAGINSNAVIGFADNTTSPNVDISTVHVVAKGGNITLNGGTNTGSGGGIAAIGTFATRGTAKSSVKVTTPFDVILKNPTSSSGTAIITNTVTFISSIASSVFNGRTVSIDPARIILLGGTIGPTSEINGAVIASGGNLELNFSDALNVNYDANNPTTLQVNTAQVFAANDLLINTHKKSFGDVIVQGGLSTLNVPLISQILARNDIQIGTSSTVGAGDVTINGFVNHTAGIVSNNGDIKANINDDLTLTSGPNPNGNILDVQLTANNLSFIAGGDITLTGSDNPDVNFQRAIIHSRNSMFLKAAGSLTVGTQGFIAGADSFSSNDPIYIEVGSDLTMFKTGFTNTGGAIENFGSGTFDFKIGQDLRMDNTFTIFNFQNGDLNLAIGRDLNFQDDATIFSFGTGNIDMTVGRDFRLSNGAFVDGSNAIEYNLTVGRELDLSGNSSVFLTSTGSLNILSEDVNLTETSKIFTSQGDLNVIANKDILVNDSSSILTVGGGDLTLVVDNRFPNPPFFGTGKFVLGSNATISSTGTTRIFTSRRAFNMIDGLINGLFFTPGIEFINTNEEQWGKYYETAILGDPFTIFYKENGTGVNPVPPRPVPNGKVHAFKIAFAEALQEWRTLDDLYMIPNQFCTYWSDVEAVTECEGMSHKDCNEECWTAFQRDLVTYNTKKLLNIYYQ